MGLDITLIDAERADLNNQLDLLYETNDDPDSPDFAVKRDEIVAKLRANDEAHPSVKHPEHFMNRRYLRSSYNDGGFNNICHNVIGVYGFYHIFEPILEKYGVDEYEYRLTEADSAELSQCAGRALGVIARLKDADPLVVTDAYTLRNDSTEAKALEFARDALEKEASRDNPFKGGWSNAEGVFFGQDGLNVIAVTTGPGVLGTHTSFLVHRLSDEAKAHYVASAEIAAEFIDEAITMIRDQEVAIIHWSG